MKRLTFLTLVLVVMATALAGCESASRFCLRNRGATCDPCAPPCAPAYDSGCGPMVTTGVPMDATTVPLPPDGATMIPGT